MIKNNIKLSVIIPVYNCEKYIRQCLESICGQQIDGLQVLCIDDCSGDASLEILYEMQKKYDCIEIYQNRVNKGQAAARNTGLCRATGEYILFMDSDDYIADNVPELLAYIDTGRADIVLFDTYMFSDEQFAGMFDNSSRIRKYPYGQESGADMLCELIKNQEMSGIVCGSIYRRKYLECQKIKFIEDGQHEDIPYIFNALLCAEKADYFHKVVYYYRKRSGSTLYMPNYRRLLAGLLSGYSNMKEVWEAYQKENSGADKYEPFIRQYLKQIAEMTEDRYACFLAEGGAAEDSLNEKIQKFHLLEKDEISRYIKPDDVNRLKNAGSIAVYGAGLFAKKLFILLQKNEMPVSCFCVTKTEGNPAQLFDRPVKKYTKDIKQDCIIIAVSEKIRNQIVQSTDFKGKTVITLL